MSRSPSYRRSSFLPLFFPIPRECPAGQIRRDIPFYAENFPFLPLYKLEKACYNTLAVKACAGGSMDRASDSGSEGWGFESLPAYQKMRIPTRVSAFFDMLGGTRKAGPGTAGVKNSPVDCFSGRGRVPLFSDASPRDVDENGARNHPPIRVSAFLVYRK